MDYDRNAAKSTVSASAAAAASVCGGNQIAMNNECATPPPHLRKVGELTTLNVNDQHY